ncbi:MAG: 3-isopropylmalate dehydratase large subunit [Bacillota bacterium]
MPQTMAEKLLSRKAGRPVGAGELAVCAVDLTVAHDGNRPQSIDILRELGGNGPWDPERVKLVIDHAPTQPNQAAAAIHAGMRQFGREFGVEVLGPGEGICHQIIPERGYVSPGDLVLGTDSHTCTYGAYNMFGSGVGSSDLAAAMLTGTLWLKVPESIRIHVEGRLRPGVYAKDAILHLTRVMTADGATYAALEFDGPGLEHLSVGSRMTMANMAVEMGAKAGLFPYDRVLADWLAGRRLRRAPAPVAADPGATYQSELTLNLTDLEPQIACPHNVDNVRPVSEVAGTPIHQAVIGTCVNGRLEDIEEAARVLRGRRVHPEVRLFVTPASREVYLAAVRSGAIEVLLEAGAVMATPGCSGCTGGSHVAIPSDGENVISTANRNFIGRLGNPFASTYLASPAVVAAAAVAGKIVDCRNYLGVSADAGQG